MCLVIPLLFLLACASSKDTGREPAPCEEREVCWDYDDDGHGDAGHRELACTVPAGMVDVCDDCKESDPSVHPGAAETCDLVDDDCDGVIDEPDAVDATTSWTDVDADGYGDPDGVHVGCDRPAGYVPIGGDCDDTDADVHPGASESCDGVDDDCDGQVDEAGAVDGAVLHPDADGDGWGSSSVQETFCAPLSGWVVDATDCDDAVAAVHPGVTEVCGNDRDDDCDGVAGPCGALSGEVPLATADAWFYGEESALASGALVSGGGDLDGDGLDDLLIGAMGVTGSPGGFVWVFTSVRPGDHPLSEAHAVFTMTGGPKVDIAIAGIASAGDTDGDGFDDFLLGIPEDETVAPGGGSVLLVRGPVVGELAPEDASSTTYGKARGEGLGSAVAPAGDQDGDGRPDLLVGATTSSTAFVLSGNTTGLATTGDVLATLRTDDSVDLGSSVAWLGDTDGDGWDDLAVAAGRVMDEHLDPYGSAFLLRGPVAGLVATGAADALIHTPIAPWGTGQDCAEVSTAGDVDGDGLADLLIGVPADSTLAASAGGAYVVPGTVTGEFSLPDGALASLHEYRADYLVGTNVAGGGDVNADGFGDLLVASPTADYWDVDNGIVYLVYGPVSGEVDLYLDAGALLYTDLPYNAPHAGYVAMVGDVDGDEATDLLVGGPYDRCDIADDMGSTWLFLGAAGM